MIGSSPGGRARRALAAVALVAITSAAPEPPTAALGPVVPITPFRTNPASVNGYNPVLSDRGEVAGVTDIQLGRVTFVQLDAAGPDGSIPGGTIAVSGNGCRSLWIDDGTGEQTVFGLIDRCNPASTRVLFTLSMPLLPFTQPAMSYTGQFAAMQISESPRRVIRLDIDALTSEVMPVEGLPGDQPDADFGIDISDDGNVVVVAMREFSTFDVGAQPAALGTDNRDLFVAAWDVAARTVGVVNDLGDGPVGSAAFPSVSADGRHVAFASDAPLVGAEGGGGPWVYVRDRATGAVALVSPPSASAYYTSISDDATQVAYGVTPTTCRIPGQIEFNCPPDRINVAYGAVPGMAGDFETETVSSTPGGANVGQHHDPSLSGNGHFVAWRSDAGDSLTGQRRRLEGTMHAFVRRRDSALAVSAVDFGTVAAGATPAQMATVTNTGRTTVHPVLFTPTNAAFGVRPGGSCVAGAALAPGASCTVNIRFTAPAGPADVSARLDLAEQGYEPVTASGDLRGRVPPSTTIDTTTTTTTTTTPPSNDPTTTTTTTPGDVQLAADPNPLDFGPVPIGIAAPFRTITVVNQGTGTGVVSTDLIGSHPDDFWVNENLCDGATLAPSQTCTLSITMIARDGGPRSAELSLTSGGIGGTVDLTGEGRYAPRLIATPEAVTVSGATTVVGLGFPPERPVTVRVLPTTLSLAATPDATGRFALPLLPLGTLELGAYVLQADAVPSVYDTVLGQLVVVLPTFEPQGPGGPAFGNALLVTRGS